MKIVRHPYIARLHEVLASRSKIYIVLEFVSGGELYDKIVHKGKLSEVTSRKYFQQLIDAVSHCHCKDSLFQKHDCLGVDLLHTTCGTPNNVAPEVLNGQGYDGGAADIWPCGVILYVLMAGYLPFEETDLPSLYRKINSAKFSYSFWFSPGAKSLIDKILDPNPKTRISIEGIRSDPWFRVNYIHVQQGVEEEVNLDVVRAVFADIEDQYVTEQNMDMGPLVINAFEMITLSQGLNLSALFDWRQDFEERQTRFVSRESPNTIISTIEAVAESMGLEVRTRSYKTRLEGISANNTGPFAVVLEVYEVAPSLFMVDVRKAAGDTLEYHKFYEQLCAKLEHIIWKSTGNESHSSLPQTVSF